MRGIFVNYRTGDGDWAAALIARELGTRFGSDNVFFAGWSIPPGADFAKWIIASLRDCQVLLAVIGPKWLTAADPEGRRRVDDPDDWVRREIVEAFRLGVRVIPVLLDHVPRLGEADLPADLAALARCQYLRLDHRNDDRDLARLLDEVTALMPEPATPPPRHRRLVPLGLAVVALAATVTAVALTASPSDNGHPPPTRGIIVPPTVGFTVGPPGQGSNKEAPFAGDTALRAFAGTAVDRASGCWDKKNSITEVYGARTLVQCAYPIAGPRPRYATFMAADNPSGCDLLLSGLNLIAGRTARGEWSGAGRSGTWQDVTQTSGPVSASTYWREHSGTLCGLAEPSVGDPVSMEDMHAFWESVIRPGT